MLEAIAKVITDAVRSILFMLDQVVYGFIPTLYELIISLAHVDLYNGNEAISALVNRVYIIVGIFMLFKLAFAILRYIVDPGSFSDSSKGFTNLVKRALIALILLVSIPWIFDELYNVQEIILDNNIISNLILGTTDSGKADIETAAIDLQFTMFGPFYSINLDSCTPSDDKPLSNIIGTTNMVLNETCFNEFTDSLEKDPTIKASGVTLDKLFKVSGAESRNFGSLGALLTWTNDKGEYMINYTPIISTLCGGYLAFLLLSFCIDVASRAIKLMFLQILSPVAIITSIDPTSSSQNDKLKEWGTECLKTFLSLFLRLTVIYVVIQMIKIITSKLFAGPENLYYGEFKGNASLNIFIYIFLILGAFSVAKKIPELLEKAFGVKMSGEMSLNPFKNFKENVGASILGVGAAAVGGGLANMTASAVEGKGLFKTLGSGIAGTTSTMKRGLTGVAHGERGFKNMRNAYGSSIFARQQRADLERQGVHGRDVMMADLKRNLGIFTDAQQQQIDFDTREKRIKARQEDFERRKKLTADEHKKNTQDFTDFKAAGDEIRGMIANDQRVKDAEARKREMASQGATKAELDAFDDNVLNEAKKEAYKELRSGTGKYGKQTGEYVRSLLNSMQEIQSRNKVIEGFGAIEKDGNFNNGAYWANDATLKQMNRDYDMAVERAYSVEEKEIADERAALERDKSSLEAQIAIASNSASRVNSPQPEGWMPTGEIQGQYRETRGPGGWDSGGRHGGPPPGGPMGRP